MSTRHDCVAGDVAGAAPQDPSHDCYFPVGRWRVQHRRLRSRLRHDTGWEHFPGARVAMPLPGGPADPRAIRRVRHHGHAASHSRSSAGTLLAPARPPATAGARS